MDGIRSSRWTLLGLSTLGAAFAFTVRHWLPIGAQLWPPALLTGVFLVFPAVLLLLAAGLSAARPAWRRVVSYGLWTLYVLGILGILGYWLLAAAGAAILDFSWDPAMTPRYAIEGRTLIILALFHVVVLPMIILGITHALADE